MHKCIGKSKSWKLIRSEFICRESSMRYIVTPGVYVSSFLCRSIRAIFRGVHAPVRMQPVRRRGGNEGAAGRAGGRAGFIFVMYFVIYVSHRLTRRQTEAGEQENKFNFMHRKLLLSRDIGG